MIRGYLVTSSDFYRTLRTVEQRELRTLSNLFLVALDLAGRANRYTASHFSRPKQLTWRYAPYALTVLKDKTAEAQKSDSHSHSEYLKILKFPKRVKVTVTLKKIRI